MAEENPVVAYEDILEEFGGDKSLVHKCLRSLLSNMEEQMPVIEKALAENNARTVEEEFHKIKGGASNLMAEQISVTATRIVALCRENRYQDAAALVPHFREEYALFRAYVSGLTDEAE